MDPSHPQSQIQYKENYKNINIILKGEETRRILTESFMMKEGHVNVTS